MSIVSNWARACSLVGAAALVGVTACTPEQSAPTPLTDLTITAPSHTVVYGDAIPALEPTYTPNRLPSTWPTCTTTATATSPAGVYPVTCSGAANGSTTLHYVNGTITITPAPLTITASSGNVIAGEPVPTITPSYAGLKAGDTQPATPPTCETSATTGGTNGFYPSACFGAVDPNYSIAYVDGSVQLASARLTVTATSHSITQGDALPLVLPQYTGWIDGDTAIDTGATCAPTVGTHAPAGTHATRCSGAVDSKYAFTYVDGSLEVKQAGYLTWAVSARTAQVSADSDGVSLPASTINVNARISRGFANYSNITVVTSNGPQVVFCAGGTETAFTGCSGGTGTLSTGAGISSAAPTDFNLATIIPGAAVNPASVTVLTDVPATQRLTPSRIVVEGGAPYLRYLQSAFPFSNSSLTFGYCATSAVYSAGSADCTTGKVHVVPSGFVTMGAAVDVAGFVQNQYQSLYLGASSPNLVKRGQEFTVHVAAASAQVPKQQSAQGNVATVIDARSFLSVFPIPDGFEAVGVKLIGGDARTSTGAVVNLCTAQGTGCTAARTGNWIQTKFPYVQASVGTVRVPGGSSVTLPTLAITLRATGAVDTVGITGLSQFQNIVSVDAGILGQFAINFNSWPSATGGTGTPPRAPITPLMQTTIN